VRKVSVIGAGNVGATVANEVARRNLADVMLIDVVEGFAAGKALDMSEAAPIGGYSARLSGSESTGDVKESEVVVITAGARRKPGMSRTELLSINAGVVGQVSREVKKHAPKSVIIVVTNPLDAMCYAAMKASGFPRERVFGMAGVLDAARMASFVAEELDVSPVDVRAMVLGGHGDSMVPLPRFTTVNGVPVTHLLEPERVEKIVERTRGAGGEIVELLKNLSAFYAPGAGAAAMVEAVLTGKGRLLPSSVWAEGEYGIRDTFVGLPALISSGGAERVVELPLEKEELEALRASARAVKESIATLEPGS